MVFDIYTRHSQSPLLPPSPTLYLYVSPLFFIHKLPGSQLVPSPRPLDFTFPSPHNDRIKKRLAQAPGLALDVRITKELVSDLLLAGQKQENRYARKNKK